MLTKGKISIADKKITVACPKCGETYKVLMVNIEHTNTSVCPKCGHRFSVKV